jgi:replicative DNA helicase
VTAVPLLGLSQRLPPNNLQAEQALLGAIQANNHALHMVEDTLAGEHFADPIRGRIFIEIARVIDAGGLADAVALKTLMEHSGVLHEDNGIAHLAQLLSSKATMTEGSSVGPITFPSRGRSELVANSPTTPTLAEGRRVVP